MEKRWLLIGGACAMALVVLLVAVLAGPERLERSKAPPLGPADVAPNFDPERALGEGMPRTQVFQDVHRGYSVVQDDRYTVMTWEQLTPKPQGVSEVQQPMARVYFAPNRVLEIRASEGTLVAPENKPQQGDLRGDVVLTMFESSGRPAELEGDGDVQLRVFLDAATFDLELGHVESEGPVRLTGPRVDFRGRGLSLTYNELRRRIEHLEIFEGQSLRFSPDAAERAPARQQEPLPARVAAAQGDTPQEGGGPRDERPAQTGDVASADEPAPEEGRQLYQAVFHDDVRVRLADGSAEMNADLLQAIFSLTSESKSEDDEAAAGEAVSQARPHHMSGPPMPLPAHLAAMLLAQTPAVQEPATLSQTKNRDVTVTWSGRLVVTPAEETPKGFAGADDLHLALLGAPATARTGESQSIVAARIEYLASAERLGAAADEDTPMLVRSPELGELTGQRLSINQRSGEGVVIGPGMIDASTAQPGEDDGAEAPLPRDLQIRWRERLNLAFYLNDQKGSQPRSESGLAGGNRLAGVRRAIFRGDVVAKHPQFDLTGQRLALSLDAPTEAGSPLRRIDAQGQVSVRAHGETPEDQMDIDARSLTIELAPDETGAAQPRRLLASGDVHAAQPNLKLNAGMLDVTLGPPPAAAAADGQDEQASEARLAFRKMLAEEDVRVVMREPDVTLSGAKLAIDVDADQLELFGTEAAPAMVVQPDSRLSGGHIIMHQQPESLQVVGPGWFDAQMDPADPVSRLQVTWRDSMDYDGAENLAHFAGNVRTLTDNATSRTKLECQDLRLDLTKVAGEGVEAAAADSPAAGRQIRHATAREKVTFIAERFAPEERGRVDSLVRLEGPVVTFDGETERVQVHGAGRMLLQDKRPAEAIDEAFAADMPGVAFAGRGDTLFLWQKQLTLDSAANDVLMEQDVQMIHKPGDGGQTVQMDCQVLLADLQEARGLSVWSEEEAADPELQLIRADEAVRIRQGQRTILADHLLYEAEDRQVLLWAAPGQMVQISEEGRPTALTARSVIWDLARDRFEARNLGPGIAPIPRR